MIKSIFPRKNQSLVDLFDSAEHPNKVACVALDYAKATHTALICDGDGRRLKAAFPVSNSPEGVEHVMERVQKICRKHSIKPRHVFFGGEACGTFAINFVHAIEQDLWGWTTRMALTGCHAWPMAWVRMPLG